MEKILNYWLPTLLMLLISIVYVVVSTIMTKNKDEKTKLLPIKIVWILLLVFEIGKIGHMIGTNKVGGESIFNPLRYPLVFCSIVLYTYPLFIFKKNKLSNVAKSLSVLPALFAFLAAVITTAGYKLTFWHAHSIVFHFLMGAVAIYLLTSKLYKFKFKDAFSLFIGLGFYIVFAVVLSLFIGGEISIFGPKSGFLGVIYNPFGYLPGNLLLLFALFLLIYFIYYMIHLIQGRSKKKTEEYTNA